MSCNISHGFISNLHHNDHDESHTVKWSILSDGYFCFSGFTTLGYPTGSHFTWKITTSSLNSSEMWPKVICFFDIFLPETIWFNLVNKTFSVTRSSNSKGRFTKDGIQKSFQELSSETMQSRLLPWWSTKCSQPLEKKNQSFLNQMKQWLIRW